MKTIQLNRGYVALVDDEDFDRVSRLNWTVHIRKDKKLVRMYARTTTLRRLGKRRHLSMHCFIMGATGIDHRDSDGLNNQKSNLRPANQSLNNANMRKSPGCASRFKGVTFEKESGSWRARACKDGFRYQLGVHANEVSAAIAYNEKMLELFGEFARINDLPT